MSKVQQPIRIKMGNGAVLEHNDPAAGLQMAQKLSQVMRGGDQSVIRAQTAGDTVRNALAPWWMTRQSADGDPGGVIRKQTIGDDARLAMQNLIAPMLGLDLNGMNALQDKGISLGMIPLAPSDGTRKLLDAGIGKLSSHTFRPPRASYINSLLVDEGGNFIDLGDDVHADAMRHLDPENWDSAKTFSAESMPKSLNKTKMVRVQFPKAGDIAFEIAHPPTPHQIDGMYNMLDANPKVMASYEFHDLAKGKNTFKNGVSAGDFIDKLFDFFHTR